MRDEARLNDLVDRTAIIETIVGLANALDAQDWARVRSLLADELEVDYSAFRGEAAKRVTADGYVAERRTGLAGLRTLHISTNHEVAIDGDVGTCVSAYQIVRVEASSGGRLETWGTYRHQLAREGRGWRVTGIVQTVTHLEGDRSIHGAFRKQPLDEEAPRN